METTVHRHAQGPAVDTGILVKGHLELVPADVIQATPGNFVTHVSRNRLLDAVVTSHYTKIETHENVFCNDIRKKQFQIECPRFSLCFVSLI